MRAAALAAEAGASISPGTRQVTVYVEVGYDFA
jgi:hypothetical protein